MGGPLVDERGHGGLRVNGAARRGEARGTGREAVRTSWGGCDAAPRPGGKRAPAKHRMACIEYLIAHELVHVVERHHGERFVQIMNQHMPQ